MRRSILVPFLILLLSGCGQQSEPAIETPIESSSAANEYGEVHVSVNYDNLDTTVAQPTVSDSEVDDYIKNQTERLAAAGEEMQGSGLSQEEYKESVAEKLNEENEAAAIYMAGVEVFQDLLARASIILNEEQVQKEYDSLLEGYNNAAIHSGLELEEFVADEGFSSLDNFHTYLRTVAEETIREDALINKIISDNNLTVSNEELREYLETLQADTDALLSSPEVEAIKETLLMEKVYEFLGKEALE